MASFEIPPIWREFLKFSTPLILDLVLEAGVLLLLDSLIDSSFVEVVKETGKTSVLVARTMAMFAMQVSLGSSPGLSLYLLFLPLDLFMFLNSQSASTFSFLGKYSAVIVICLRKKYYQIFLLSFCNRGCSPVLGKLFVIFQE